MTVKPALQGRSEPRPTAVQKRLGANSPSLATGQYPDEPGARPRLIVVDDHRMVVEGLCSCLRPDHEIVGVAYSANELLSLLGKCKADCVLLDLEMPGRNGLEIIADVRRLQPSLRIIVVTMMNDQVLAEAALGAGASGFVPKDAGSDELKTAIAEVLAGLRYVSKRIPRAGHRVGLGAVHSSLHRLTPRQQEIVLLLGDGKRAKDVADLLYVGRSTITFHKHNIMRVLGLTSEGALLRYAVLVRAAASDAPDSR